ncbi:alcohol dehydrogenase [Corynascus novoguineensis]|uniref:Alcohol dehydrogenase n=1 Tax=Corynascus novoguineensis TaxID=1126955 RepID=A0AAN7CLU9_9PEZI|nr:alcohol dehydrogenase [Corynascus novoguineensis]
MSIPSTQKQWVIQSTGNGLDELVYQDASVPKLGQNEVLVKLRGASINFRDLLIPKGEYVFPLNLPIVAGSDGAGEIVAVGPRVTKWKPGDRVVTLFNQGHQSGRIDEAATRTGLGGCIDGTLRQYGAFDQDGLARMPANLDFVEAATLCCAALTSWNALNGLRRLAKGETVLVQGTGASVYLHYRYFAKAAGATVIATTSSAEKAKILKKIGADHVINYREDPNWGETARKLSPGGAGVDHVIEIGGEGTMTQSLRSIKYEGIISVIGMLGGMQPKDSIMEALAHVCVIRGVYVGSKAQLEEMIAAIEKHDIHPVVDDKVFTLDETKDALEYLMNQKHFGKIGIKIE